MRKGLSVRNALAPALLLFVLACFWFEGREPPPQVDDAYISYRYALNLVEGHGLVYNVGERVEGFTNLLWTLLVAAGLALGMRATEVGYGLGLASGTVALIASYAYAEVGADRDDRWIGVVAPALLLAWIGFPVWTFSGLETPMFAAACAVALVAEAHGRIGTAILATIAATLTRPEGALLAAVILGVNALRGVPLRRKAVAWGFGYAGMLAILTAFRLYYYGSPVPNTFFAKVGTNVWLQGVAELGSFVSGSVLPLIIPAAWVVRRDPKCLAGGLFVLVMTIYIVSVGGDAFTFYRFWVPVHLVIAVFAARALILQRETISNWSREAPLWAFVIASGVWAVVSARAAFVVLAALAVAALAGIWGRGAQRATAFYGAVAALIVALVLTAPWVDDETYSRWRTIAAHLAKKENVVDETAPRLKQVASLVLAPGRDSSRGERIRTTLNTRRDHLQRAADSARRIEARLRQGEEIDLIAVTAIGKFGYDVRLPILDMLGLVDAHIARSPIHKPSKPVLWLAGHMRTDADYVFERRPDYIFIPRAWSAALRLPVHDDIWTNPALDRDYEWDDEMRAYRRAR